jgi:hypothetical protein
MTLPARILWLYRQTGAIEIAARLRLAILKKTVRQSSLAPPVSIATRRVFDLDNESVEIRRTPPISGTAGQDPPWHILSDGACFAAAERVFDGHFTLFGGFDYDAKDTVPDWFKAFPEGEPWSDAASFDIDISGGDGRDVRFTWELSRHGDLVMLARAAAASGKDKYRDRLETLLADWIARNAALTGPNWISALEVGVRAVSWTVIDDVAPVRDAAARRRFLETLYQHGAYLGRFLSIGLNPSNHIIGEAAGLFVLACKFAATPGAAAWRTRARRILEREIIRQTYPSGASREHSVNYHRFVASLFSICESIGGFSGRFSERLEAMRAFLRRTVRPDGTFAAIGDSDDATTGVLALFDAANRGGEREKKSTSIDGIDLVVMRSGNERLQVEFDRGPQGLSPVASHGHADALSLTLWRGRERLIDPGTYRYNADGEWRKAFRTTAFHNTVTVDGKSQAETASPFRWMTLADARPAGEFFSDDFDWAAGVLKPAQNRRWAHEREVLRAGASLVIVIDRVTQHGSHVARANLHLGNAEVIIVDGVATATYADGARMQFAALSEDAAIEVASGWRSEHYGVKEASTVLATEARFHDNFVLPWFVAFGADAKIERTPIDKGGGAAARISCDDGDYLFLCREEIGLAHVGDVRFAGRWALLRMDGGKVAQGWAADAWALEQRGKRLFTEFGGGPVGCIYG